MQQVTVNVPDKKVAFFEDLTKNLGFTVQKKSVPGVLTKKQIALVNDARKKIKKKPEQFLDWNKAKRTITTMEMIERNPTYANEIRERIAEYNKKPA
jgi:hypothetical protein